MAPSGRNAGVPEGSVDPLPASARPRSTRRKSRSRQHVCPECDHHFTDAGPRPDRPVARRGQLRGVGHRPASRATRWSSWTASRTTSGWSRNRQKTGMPDAAVTGKGFIRGRPVVLGITDFAFMAGSMGSVVGEKLTRAAEEATELRAAADLRQRLRRRGADAGGHPVAHADGQGVRGAGPLRLGRRALHLASSRTRRWAASPRAGPCRATSRWPSPGR